MFEVTLSQIFVAAMVISQVLTDPANLKTHFDPKDDQAQVIAILRKGCPAVLKQLTSEVGLEMTVEQTGFSELMKLFIDSGQELPVPGLKATTLDNAFKMFCKGEDSPDPEIKLGEIIVEYNKALQKLPDLSKMKGYKLPQSSLVLDVFGNRFTEVYKDRNRRTWIPLAEIPKSVTMAFVSAEDSRFFQHKGVDVRGVLRAYMNNQSKTEVEKKKRPEGGSTITQQVIKNLLIGGVIENGAPRVDDELTEGAIIQRLGPGDEITAARKIREMVLAAKLEQILTKDEILELYLNYVFLGRASWGIEMASQSYFKKSIRQVDKLEAAILAGLTKGPNFFNPDVFPDRTRGRTAYVLEQMLKVSKSQEQKFLTQTEHDEARKRMDAWDPAKPEQSTFKFETFEGPRSKGSFYFISDIINDSAIGLGEKKLTDEPYVVKTTIHPNLQPIAEAAVQETLAEYEISTGRIKWAGAEKNIKGEIEKFADENPDQNAANAWHKVLLQTKAPLFDVHWPIAVVVQTSGGLKVGLKDGSHMTLKTWNASVGRQLKMYDIVHVKIKNNVAELRTRPKVQGAAVILENRSGRVLALAGGFSYAVDHYNRATSMMRQPGSTVKPLAYLAALQSGARTTSMIPDEALTFESLVRGQPDWYVGPGTGNSLTLRQGLERSNNQVTARLLYQIGRGNPAAGLDTIQNLCMETKLCSTKPFRGFPFVLGSHEVRLIDLAAFYATIANDGVRARPYYVESINLRGTEIYNVATNFREGLQTIRSVSLENFREVKSILQGVLARGTGHRIRKLAPFVGGKTGTTNAGKDVWFVGFTNDITIATWVGYDKPMPLGNGCSNDEEHRCTDNATGGIIALPIFDKIISKVTEERAYKAGPLVALNAPHPELAVAAAAPEQDTDERTRVGNWWPAPAQQRYDQRRPYWAPPEDYEDMRRQRYQQQQRRGQPYWSPFQQW